MIESATMLEEEEMSGQTKTKTRKYFRKMLSSKQRIKRDTAAIQTRTPVYASRNYKIPVDALNESVYSLLLPTTEPKLFRNQRFKSTIKSDRKDAICLAEKRAHGIDSQLLKY